MLLKDSLNFRDRAMVVINQAHLLGFDLHSSPEFTEFYLTNILGGKTTKKQENFDCLLPNETKIEFKHANPVQDKVDKWGRHPLYFIWSNIRGTKNRTGRRAKVGAVDYLVLSGYYAERLYIWVIPFKEVDRDKLEYQITERKKRSFNWLEKYYIGDEIGLYKYFYEPQSLIRPIICPLSLTSEDQSRLWTE